MKVVVSNRKAHFNYQILTTFVAGIVLTGAEIKAIRAKEVNINDAYVIFKDQQPWVINMHINKYEHASSFIPDPTRSRQLLLKKNEIKKLIERVKLEKLSVVVTKVVLTNNLAKLEIALAKGKKAYDKRETIKQRDEERRFKRR